MLWGAVCTDSLLVRPCVLLAAHRALQLLKVLGVSFFSNGGHPLRAAAVSRLPAFPGKCQLAASRPATSGGSISSDQCANSLEYEVVLCHCLRCFQRTITAEPSAPMRCHLTIPGCRIGWDARMTSTWSWLTGRARKLSPMRTAPKQKPNAVDRARTTTCPISSFESNGYGQT